MRIAFVDAMFDSRVRAEDNDGLWFWLWVEGRERGLVVLKFELEREYVVPDVRTKALEKTVKREGFRDLEIRCLIRALILHSIGILTSGLPSATPLNEVLVGSTVYH
jgi:hypothetical protein